LLKEGAVANGIPASTTSLSFSNRPLLMNNPLLFVIPSEPGFPTSLLSQATTYVVLLKENHMQLTEPASLDRKSGGAEGSAVPRTLPGYTAMVRTETCLEWRFSWQVPV
jgi:hypothetical protein